MERLRRIVVAGALLAAFLSAIPVVADDRDASDERAVARLDAMTNALAKAARLRTTIEGNWDVTQPTGEKIEFGETRTMSLRRPDRLRVETTRRDGARRVFLFDGTQLAVSDPELKVYATASRPGTLDAALDYLDRDLHMRMPMRELFAADLPKQLAPLRRTARLVATETVAGVATDHLFLRGDGTDIQVWIPTEGEPLPRRIVITYRQEEGQPQFRASFTDWSLSPDLSDDLFIFTPAEGMEKIPFAVSGEVTPGQATKAAPEEAGR